MECDVKEHCYWFKRPGDEKCKFYVLKGMWEACRARLAIVDLLVKTNAEKARK